MADFYSKRTGEQIEALLDIVSQGGGGGGEGGTITEAEITAMGFTKNLGTITEVKMNGVSKGTDGVVDLGNVITEHQDISGKQDKIEDLDAIRAGAAAGATALQVHVTSFSVEDIYKAKYDGVGIEETHKEGIVQAIKDGKKIATYWSEIDGFYLADATLEGLELVITYPASNIIIDTFTTDEKIYPEDIIINIYVTEEDLSPVATTGSYNDLSNKPTIPAEQVNADWNATSGKAQILNKPTIPSAVTESTVSGWGFTKNTGTYSKPSGGIPKSDLASAVQTSLGKADTALQSYTEQYKGTITGVAINGTAIATSGVAYIPSASTESHGTTKLNSSTNSTSTSEAATPSAVKAAYDLANGKQDKLTSGTNIKTINGQSLLGSGNITIDGGSGGVSQEAFDSLVNTVDNIDADVAQLTKDVQEKQDKLVSGTNIKTINGQSLLGGGDITIEGGGSSNDIYVFVVEDESGTITEEEFNAIRSAKIVNINIGQGFDVVSVFKTDWSEEGLGIALAGTINYDSSRTSITVSIQNDLTYSVNYGEEIIPTFTSQLENDSNFVSSDNLKTINGQSLVGSGDITISGGGGSSSGGSMEYIEIEPDIELGGATLSLQEAEPNKTYIVTEGLFWLEIQSFVEPNGLEGEYRFHFKALNCAITLPDSVLWANGQMPDMIDGICELSIIGTRYQGEVVYKAILTAFA